MNQRVPLVELNFDHSRSDSLHIADSLLIYAFHFCIVLFRASFGLGGGGGQRGPFETCEHCTIHGVRARLVMPPKLSNCQLLGHLDNFSK